jgi:hypothetical protein
MAPADRLAVFAAGIQSRGEACLGRSAAFKGQDATGSAYWVVDCERGRFVMAIGPDIAGSVGVVSCRLVQEVVKREGAPERGLCFE